MYKVRNGGENMLDFYLHVLHINRWRSEMLPFQLLLLYTEFELFCLFVVNSHSFCGVNNLKFRANKVLNFSSVLFCSCIFFA